MQQGGQLDTKWARIMLTCGSSQSPVSSQSSALITTRVQTSASMPCVVGVAKGMLQGCRAQQMRPHLHAAYDAAARLTTPRLQHETSVLLLPKHQNTQNKYTLKGAPE